MVGGGTRAPGRRRPGRPRVPRRALTQHKVAEAPGHALGQVVHIELHGVQRQRLLHGDAGAAAAALVGKVEQPFPPGDGEEREERAAPVPVVTGREEGATLPGRMRGRPAPAGPPRHCATEPGRSYSRGGGRGG